jgi:hypothetical protein
MTIHFERPKKAGLVPFWLVTNANAALARMARRPVLVAIDELEMTMPGQVLDLSMTHATVQPAGVFYLCKSVYVECAFRYGEMLYSLSGTADPSTPDKSFRMEFDTVARKAMAELGVQLRDAGLIDSERAEKAKELTRPLEAERQERESWSFNPRKVRHDGPPGGVERRAHSRYDVETEVRLTLVEEGRRVECTMIDLSMSGCRLYFSRAESLELGAQVEVQFIGDGLPLRLAAVVQVVMHLQSAGLRFVNVPERMKERLEDLIQEITAGRAIAAR